MILWGEGGGWSRSFDLQLFSSISAQCLARSPRTHSLAASGQDRGRMQKIRGFISFEFEVHASRPRVGQAWHGRAGMHAQEQAGCVGQGRSAGRQTAKIQEGARREQHLKPSSRSRR